MPKRNALWLSCLLALPLTAVAAQQARPAPQARTAAAAPHQPPAAPADAAPSNKDVAATQHELIQLLRLSPTLTTVVSHDPSLLADQAYVARTTLSSPTSSPRILRSPAIPTSISSPT